MAKPAPILPDDGLPRCPWPEQDPLYVAYHDTEWGVPEYDDRALYEKLVLDGFQAGLAWITILRKRENFRKAFDGFQPEKIARYTPKKIEKLMKRRRHRAQPRQDRGRDSVGARLAGDHGTGARAFPTCCGTMSAASRRTTTSAPSARSRRKPISRARCRRS